MFDDFKVMATHAVACNINNTGLRDHLLA
ncbi:protein of unknown function [Burkholderia multivorans]